MAKRDRVKRIQDSDENLAATFEAAVVADTPPAPPAPPVEDLSLPQAVWPEKTDAPKARVFAKWGVGVMDMFRACIKPVQDAIIRNLAVAVQAGEIATDGTSDGKAVTPVSATLFAELKAKAEAFLSSLPITDRGLAADKVKEALGFILLMQEKNPGLDLGLEKTQAELAEKRVRKNFFVDGVDFKPAIKQAEEAAQSASETTENFLVDQLRDKAADAGQGDVEVSAFIDEVTNLANPSDRRYRLIGRIFELETLLRPAFTPRPATSRPGYRRPGDPRARFSARR
jgi:hypothetical protein